MNHQPFKAEHPGSNLTVSNVLRVLKKGYSLRVRDYDHAYRLIFECLEAFYNTKRIHSHCDYMSPNDYEELYRRLQQGELQMAG